MRKAKAFRGGANKTASPCFPKAINGHLATVPVEQLQRNITLQKILLLGKTIFNVRQKGVPPLLLPASVLQLQQEKQTAKYNLLRKCGLLAHTSAAFLKNCCTEKLFRSPAARILLCTIKISLLYCHSVTPFILRMPSMPLNPHKFHFMPLQQWQQLLP